MDAETGFADNKTLFGFDSTEGIVAVEFAPPNIAVVFGRQPDGTKKVNRSRFRPFAWQESESGLLTARYFPDWRSLPRGKGKGGHDRVLYDPVNQYLLGSGRTLFKGMAFEDLRRMQIDIETAISPGYEFSVSERDPLLAIAVADSSGWEELILVEEESPDSERHALERLCRFIAERDPDVIEGHNFFKFDLPYLAERARRLGVGLTFGRNRSVLKCDERPSRFSVGGQPVEFPAFRVLGRHIVDTYLLAQAYDVAGRQLESYGLKAIAAALGVREPGRIVLEGPDIQRAYREDREAFRAYALTDVRETRAVSGILSRSYFVQAQIFPYNYQDVIIRGSATKIDSLFLREYLRRGVDIPVPPEKRKYEGGWCEVYATGVINNVWHCDVASLYPSTMLAFGYLPKNDRLGIFGAMLRDLRAFRLEAKRQAKAAADPIERNRLEALQATFKILINSAYGYLAFPHGHFADFEAAAAVTAKGREILQKMVDWLLSSGARVVEIDTDGIYFSPPDGVDVQELTRKLAAELPEGIMLELGEHYPAMFSYRSKNAAFLKADGSMIVKGGALRSRELEPYLRRYLQATLRLLLEGRPDEVGALYDGLVRQITLRELPITDFAQLQTLHVPLEEYRGAVEANKRNKDAAFELVVKSGRAYAVGDQLSYYIAVGGNGKAPLFERAKLISEWDPNNRDEDVAYYLARLDKRAFLFDRWSPHHPQVNLAI